jgi:hypothetical protein
MNFKKLSADGSEQKKVNSSALKNIEAQESYMKTKKAVSSARMTADSTRSGQGDMTNYKVAAMKAKLAKRKMK